MTEAVVFRHWNDHLDILCIIPWPLAAGEYPLVMTNMLWKYPPFFMGKSTISMAIFNSYVSLPEGNYFWARALL